MRLGDQRVGVLGIDSHHQPALTAGRDRHVAADEERQPAEHPLLGDLGLAGDQLADAVGEIFVIRHRGIMVLPKRVEPSRVAAPTLGDDRPVLEGGAALERSGALKTPRPREVAHEGAGMHNVM